MGFRGSDDQRNITAFQRQVITAEESRRAEKKKERQEEMKEQSNPGSGPSRPVNSRANTAGSGGGGKQEETVRYINESENPDFEDPE